ncbi:hypothetical protein EMIHUDRAFT_227936 [Emiliania huxleyi CCMP1516]|uniref:Secreted protein n=2 Tax=Emiliania huxleyi TaxID=2903 RepID=A0A0D3KGP5_EMIH1|nr:hypothetical protein EMIHUDRAFT_227936 [Emiliania huxleyi CCMP1516]EOD34930.1 hypothetical protein EMIHUDRAFT_227936 [Emiliania huxleyi CCMP1516]|eukprot:XP_005787359.1 hypothetical protein EMIHUDRAFT_227936 [Emiliania huxleyi CCMP1516]
MVGVGLLLGLVGLLPAGPAHSCGPLALPRPPRGGLLQMQTAEDACSGPHGARSAHGCSGDDPAQAMGVHVRAAGAVERLSSSFLSAWLTAVTRQKSPICPAAALKHGHWRYVGPTGDVHRNRDPVQSDGVAGLWHGYRLNIVRTIPQCIITFTAYETAAKAHRARRGGAHGEEAGAPPRSVSRHQRSESEGVLTRTRTESR